MLRNLSLRATHPALRLYSAITHRQSPQCFYPASAAQKRHLQCGRNFRSRSPIMACEDCAKPAAEERGNFWAGEPSGKEVKMHGIDTYIAEAASPTGKAVLMIPDVYGAAPVRLGRQQPSCALGLIQHSCSGWHCCRAPWAWCNARPVLIPVSLAGWDAKNNRLFADKLAASGLTTALPGAAHFNIASNSWARCRSMRGVLHQQYSWQLSALLPHPLPVQRGYYY